MADKKKGIDGFIAVRMPAAVRKRLESVSEALREAGVSGEWQEEGTHHLTLKYIGKIGSEKYDAIAEALREPCGALSLPTFTIGPLFTFKAHNGNTVLAARVAPKDDLERLFRVLERVATENGVEKSRFPSFKPHVTLCYLDDKEDWQRAKAEIDPPDEFGELTIATVPLNESKGAGRDFEIRRMVRVGRRRAFHDVWAAMTPAHAGGGPPKVTPPASSFPSVKATEATCPHCDWSPVSKQEDGSFRCPTCTMQFWPSGEGPNKRKRKAPKEGVHQCVKCGQGIMAHGEANESEGGKVYCTDCYDGNFAQCGSCEKEVRKGAEGTTELDGDWFCKDCPPLACENCSEDVHPDEAMECEEQTFCEECYEENCVTCADCSETMLKENAIDAFDMWFCEDHRPYSCESCDEYITEDSSYSTNSGMYCEMCYEKVREEMSKEQWDDFYASNPKLEEIDALQKAAEQDEDGMTPDTYAKIFADMDWDSSYGGDAWAHIAETWRDLARASDSKDWTRMLVLTDHAFDLAHNNGSLFTKAKPEVQKWLFKALEEKYFRDPLVEYRDKLSADARKLLDAHIRYNAGGLGKWKEQMEGKAGAMRRLEKAVMEHDGKMAKRVWEAFGLSVPMFKGRDAFLDVAFWSVDQYNFAAEGIREFMRTEDPERLVKLMVEISPATCKPGSKHPAASYLWEKFVPKAIEVVEKTSRMREKMRESPAWYQDRLNEWDQFIQSAKRRRKEDAKDEKSLATALVVAFLKVALNRTDFYDFYALTVVDCAGLPDDMVRLCSGLKKVTLMQVSDAIMAILRRAVVREARHVQYHVGTEY